jgi:hypothetical protein
MEAKKALKLTIRIVVSDIAITKDRDALRAVLSDRAKEMKREQEAR